MDAFPVTLVMISTFMHAAWNLLLRYKGGTQTCFWRMQVSIVVLGAVPALGTLIACRIITPTAIICLLCSGVCCGVYYFCLAKGYESGDFTTVYPASRALPVMLIGIGDAVRGRPPNAWGWFGMLFVALGCLLVPLNAPGDLRLRYYLKPATLWIVLAALGTVGYSLFDKIGTEAIPRGPREAAVYSYLFQVVALISSFLLHKLFAKPKTRDQDVGWAIPATAGVLCFAAYWLVLWAYQMVPQASYVVAFRQFSIVIGVLSAFLLFDEPGKGIRLAGSICITAGLVLLKMLGA